VKNNLQQWFKDNEKKNLEDFFSFLKFSTIGTDPSFKSEMEKCAAWLIDFLKDCQMKARLLDTPSYPVVFAEKHYSDNVPTLLIYGHYDVQPVDPLDLWDSDPFEPTMKGNTIYARGALDNKGQIFYVLLVMKALHELLIDLPLNIKLCIEGEEESGSEGLSSILSSEKETLKADSLLVVDLDIPDKNTPAITLGARGIVTMDVEVIGADIDLHSGHHGGIAFNPIRALVDVLAKLWDEKGVVTIKSFYDDVEEVATKDFDLSFDEKQYVKEFGVRAFSPEGDYTVVESNWFRPAIEINGIEGGYHGKGFKTVLPAKAHAKLSCRIVPHQTPEKVGRLIAEFLKENIHKGLKINVDLHHGGSPIISDKNSLLAKCTSTAYSEVFKTPCKNIMAGGSVPIIAEIAEKLDAIPVMMGMGLASDNIHAPNEHFGWDRLEKGFQVVGKILELMAHHGSS